MTSLKLSIGITRITYSRIPNGFNKSRAEPILYNSTKIVAANLNRMRAITITFF